VKRHGVAKKTNDWSPFDLPPETDLSVLSSFLNLFRSKQMRKSRFSDAFRKLTAMNSAATHFGSNLTSDKFARDIMRD
jgi:hypothetical protein